MTVAAALIAMLLTYVAGSAPGAGAGAGAPAVFSYPDGSTMGVRLVGAAGDSARITFTPAGANASFLRYQGFINESALATTQV